MEKSNHDGNNTLSMPKSGSNNGRAFTVLRDGRFTMTPLVRNRHAVDERVRSVGEEWKPRDVVVRE